MLLVTSPAAQDVSDTELERASGGSTVRVRIASNGTALVDLPVELYVARVLAGEGEPRAPAAAQQALAIAIRTFVAANAGRHRGGGFDMCDTTHCQVLRPSTPASRAAALATASQLLTYQGRPAAVFYSASCGGRSEAASQMWAGAGDLPYLRSAEDDVHGDDESWTVDVPLTRVEQTLRRIGFEGRHLRDVEVERRTGSGRVAMVRLSGLRPDSITGDDLRAAIGAREVRSTQFRVTKRGGLLHFEGRGYGHGVGLCVVGAGRRAARGETAAEILEQYYPGVRVESLPTAARTAAVEPVVRDSARAHDLLRRARHELAAATGIAAPPELRLEVHPSLAAFQSATGRHWWVAFAVTGSVIDLPPLASVEQSSDGLDASLRRAVAEVLTAEAFAGRPAWVRVGAGRYYASAPRIEQAARGKCPTDAELTMPVSAAAHRDAELRAEACFARALAKTGDWRRVR